ncbi:MAG TPA: glycosyltransferase, partial [Abditibacteriaceae bacterium]|nr:glycosyltransferase [Abditibacteriaceae bacterium]
MSPKLSIVLASHNARATIELCLNALKAQGEEYAQRGEKIEVVIVDNSTDGTAQLLEQLLEQLQQQAFIDFHLVRRAASLLIPELWEIGINESQGDIVALTTAHCIPAADWIEQILKAHEKPHAGIGGAIENAPDVGSVQWAIY